MLRRYFGKNQQESLFVESYLDAVALKVAFVDPKEIARIDAKIKAFETQRLDILDPINN